MGLLRTLTVTGLTWLSLTAPSLGWEDEEIITRDVAIVGGGASGTFSAVQLHDQGKSVVVIEKEDVMGGHTNTYQDPVTKKTVDYGVVVFHNQQVVRDYFTRLNVSYIISTGSGTSSKPSWLDVHTATPVNYTSPDPTAGLAAYKAQLEKYHDLELGFFLPNPVPDDLLLPFGEFATKYQDIGNAVYKIFEYAQGLGDFLNQPTLYVLKAIGLEAIQAISTGFLVTKSQNTYEIYDHAAALLGKDVLLQSHVVSTEQRDTNGINLTVMTPHGKKAIHAKKLLISIPQKLINLIPFDLDGKETSLFGEFINTGYYTSLVRNTGLSQTFNMKSVSSNTRFNIPQMPGVYQISPTAIPDVFGIKYGSPTALPDEYVKNEILGFVKKLQINGLANITRGPEFVTYKSHSPFELRVSPSAIQAGFYKDMYALQGYRNTWYTGAAFHTQSSSMLWNFTESNVLPQLLK
jgi:hypothetical protein